MPRRAARPSVDLVVFDLGGVLVRIARSWREAHEAAGLPHHAVLDSDRFHVRRAELARDHQRHTIDLGAWCAGIADCSEGAYTAEEALRILDAWTMEEYPGVGAVIEAVHAAGVQTAALSNTNARHWLRLRPDDTVSEEYPTVALLQRHFASHLMGVAKPDPAIYRALEQETGHRGDRIVFFDDTAANVDAADALGWRAHLVDHAGDPATQMRGVLRVLGI